jgi:hypothetical protein
LDLYFEPFDGFTLCLKFGKIFIPVKSLTLQSSALVLLTFLTTNVPLQGLRSVPGYADTADGLNTAFATQALATPALSFGSLNRMIVRGHRVAKTFGSLLKIDISFRNPFREMPVPALQNEILGTVFGGGKILGWQSPVVFSLGQKQSDGAIRPPNKRRLKQLNLKIAELTEDLEGWLTTETMAFSYLNRYGSTPGIAVECGNDIGRAVEMIRNLRRELRTLQKEHDRLCGVPPSLRGKLLKMINDGSLPPISEQEAFFAKMFGDLEYEEFWEELEIDTMGDWGFSSVHDLVRGDILIARPNVGPVTVFEFKKLTKDGDFVMTQLPNGRPTKIYYGSTAGDFELGRIATNRRYNGRQYRSSNRRISSAS